MVGEVLDINSVIEPDDIALAIVEKWREWVVYRNNKIQEWKELRNYLFATDTRTTSNRKLPWANSTTTPKLTQIRDNLHANYIAALFPNRNWLKWEGKDKDGVTSQKAKVIESYIKTKIKDSGFEDTVSQLVLDWIDTGNCFAFVDHVVDFVDFGNGDIINAYTGPILKRISPYDIVFNPTVARFSDTPKIVKEIVTLGDIKKRILNDPVNNAYLEPALDRMIEIRGKIAGLDSELDKADGYIADGFSSITHYFGSGYVEILHFIGDFFDVDSGELYTNRIISIADRAILLRNIPNPSWNSGAIIRHAAWRKRPDNLYGMGPLENLVGLQYRIDHLENLKADVFDQIAYPIIKVKGDVMDFDFSLGERIYIGEEGDVSYLIPDGTALNADFQIKDLENKMEELAGAPRSAMGIRTPGEKTAFEVSVLDRGAARVFQHKAREFEKTFLEPLLNDMLEVGRRNLDTSDVIRILDDTTGAELFETVTREDISAKGVLRPVGARHFEERAIRLQNLQVLWQIRTSDPSVGVHTSGKQIAKILTEELDEPEIYKENVGVFEQLETQQLLQEAQVQADTAQAVAMEEGV